MISGCQTIKTYCCYEPSCLVYYDEDTTFGDEENGKLAEKWIKFSTDGRMLEKIAWIACVRRYRRTSYTCTSSRDRAEDGAGGLNPPLFWLIKSQFLLL